MKKFLLLFILPILFNVNDVYASGAVAQRRSAQQRAMQQRAIQQRVAQQKAAIQQQIMMKKVALEQQKVQQAVASKVASERVRAQQQAAAEYAVRKAKQQVQANVLQGGVRANLEQRMRNTAFQAEFNVPVPAAEDVKEIADFSQVIESLDKSSHAWPLIIDREAKEAVINHYIQQYQQKGIIIQNPPLHYVGMTDSMSQNSPDMLTQPFPNVLRVMAIMEYDFNNGQNQDNMVRELLGEEGYHKNKQRFLQLQRQSY